MRATAVAVSERRGLVEWRALALYLKWRLRAACASDWGADTEVLVEPTRLWVAMMRTGGVERSEESRYRKAVTGNAALAGEERRRWTEGERARRTADGEAPGLDRRAASAKGWWRRGGGRRRAEWLRGTEVQEGRMADKRGRWPVEALLDVRRPEERHGLQLEVLVRWRGEDPVTGAYWGEEWRNIMDLTGDLKEGARRMERTKYPKRAALEPVQGQRSSERLREGGGKRRKIN